MKFQSKKKKSQNSSPIRYLGLEGEYDKYLLQGKKLILCVTVGRSGTRWLSDIFSKHRNAIASCERHSIIESIYRYVKWNKLPIDVQGIVDISKDSIVQDWKDHDISMVTSPYFSHDLLYLYETLKPEYIIWGVNDPKFTVTSFYNKGWYNKEKIRKFENLTYGIQPSLSLNQSFGRIIPKEKEYPEWKKLTRIGKIAWLYSTINLEIYNDLKKIPKESIFIFKLEEADQNYEYYLKYAHKFGLKEILLKDDFLSVKKLSVKDNDNIKSKWSEKEKNEFKKIINEFNQIYKNL